MKVVAILGPTASGKTSLSITLAKKYNANILSLDSLSVYKEINIASAKPSVEERDGIKHFGIDVLHVNDVFNVTLFFDLFKEAQEQSLSEGKNLIIVGGTGFYLKAMITGMSFKPEITADTKKAVSMHMQNLQNAYKLLSDIDSCSAKIIKSNDSYRIEKWLEIYLQTDVSPSLYFKKNKKEPLIADIELFEIDIPKEILRERITQRTDIMLKSGLIDEVFHLEKKYSRMPNPMRAIGIKETLDFLDGNLNKEELRERIVINTAKLAKRQKTFNTSQFQEHVKGSVSQLQSAISKVLQ
jgi:tRNA dimethylallyltransferase